MVEEEFRHRTIAGVDRELPQAAGRGRVGDRARWLMVRGAIADTIGWLPVGERRVLVLLQEAWGTACARVESLSAEAPGEECLFPL